MTPSLRLCLVLHNHQPIGNFDGVFQQAFEDSYRPFLDVFERYPDLKIALHTSGPLLEWLDEHQPEYLDRVAGHVLAGRIEIVGGPFYEPILTMIPPRDRVGQIRLFTEYLERRLGARVRGMWTPERVWEQSLVADLVAAGMQYTILDDFHFRNAGLDEDELHGHYLTEDDGRVMCLFPGSERLRYTIPFASPHDTIHYLRGIAERHPGAVCVFGDDGEKFGSWPETKKHVYHDGWLTRFFEALLAEQSWLQTTTPSEALDSVSPLGKIYLPDGSYREMTEWALPVERQGEYDQMVHDLEHDERWPRIKRFVRGGFWRNFKVKYPETNEMYCRMQMVSRRLQETLDEATADGTLTASRSEKLEAARRELYRGQCNCSYWHGAFGGIYLPHLRNAVFNHLIAAENLCDQAVGRNGHWVEATADDYNFDARQEVRLANGKLVALVAPAQGGELYELDVRSICHNLLASFTRRPEAYHRKVLAGANPDGSQVASIHERVIFKQAGLDQRLQYDRHRRKSLLDHFFEQHATLESVAAGEAVERGDFLQGIYEAKIRRSSDRVQVVLARNGSAFGLPVKVTKGITLEANSGALQIAYLLEGLPRDSVIHFGAEFNFAGLPAGADDRYFYQGAGKRLGQLGARLDLHETTDLGLVDEWLGIDVHLAANQPTHFWTFPVETVSQSEGGFELVHQSVVVLPHWYVRADAEGRWSVTLDLTLDTSRAESRFDHAAQGAASL